MKSSWFGNAQSAGKTAHFCYLCLPAAAVTAAADAACFRRQEGDDGPGRRMPPEASLMPFEIRDEGQFFSIRLFGVLDRVELNAVTNEVERLEDEGPPKDRLTDFTALERIDVGFEEVFAQALRRANRQVAAPIRSALLANRPVQFGFARMFQMLNDNPRIQIRIFGTLEEAQQWLQSSRR